VNLPLSSETFVTTRRGCLHGPLADATPDRWGRDLAALRAPGKLFSPIDWLHVPGRDRVGSLDFSAKADPAPAPAVVRLGLASLGAIAAEFAKIQAGLPADPEATRIYNAGISMGGARPKAIVEDGGSLWIAKFERNTDTFDQCGAEHAAMRLAAICGIEVAQTRLVAVGPRSTRHQASQRW
jgi:serine/threonine-protein kinase HipA